MKVKVNKYQLKIYFYCIFYLFLCHKKTVTPYVYDCGNGLIL